MSSPLETPSFDHEGALAVPIEVFYEDMTGLANTARLVRRKHAELTRDEAFAVHKGVLGQTGRLALADSLVLAPDRTKPPRNIAQYDLVPVVPRDPYEIITSLSPICSRIKTNGDVTFEYDRPSGDPYVDSQIGLALTYNGRCVALCAGGLSEAGPFIRQLQDISRPKLELEDPKAYLYSSGLRSGFMWRDTLIRAWSAMLAPVIANVLPDFAQNPTSIQSARNNSWIYTHVKDYQGNIHQVVDLKKLARQQKNYDLVALRLGGKPDHSKGDYVLSKGIIYEQHI
jgi:hypothetical protein